GLAYGKFVFSIQRTGAVAIRNASPLVAVHGLHPVFTGENSGKSGISQKRRLEELREMNVLRMHLMCAKQDGRDMEYSLFHRKRVTLPFKGTTTLFSQSISIMYTYTSELAGLPL